MASINFLVQRVEKHTIIRDELALLSNAEKVIKSWGILEQTLSSIPIKHNEISMGDFNTQLGKE